MMKETFIVNIVRKTQYFCLSPNMYLVNYCEKYDLKYEEEFFFYLVAKSAQFCMVSCVCNCGI